MSCPPRSNVPPTCNRANAGDARSQDEPTASGAPPPKRARTQAPRCRAYVWTLNNWSPEEEEALKARILSDPSISYTVWGQETAESGTPHLQGYTEFSSVKSLKNVTDLIPRCHAEARRGTAQQAAQYCKKTASVIFEHGSISRQGSRTDLDTVRTMIQEGQGMRAIAASSGSFQAMRGAEMLLKYVEPTRDWKPQVFWLWGATGTNKTRTCRAAFPQDDSWWSGSNAKWWNGYDAHPVVIFDHFRLTDYSFKELLRLFDRYPYMVENKGGTRQLLAKTMVVTCPQPPTDMQWSTDEDIQQLLRRIDLIHHMDDRSWPPPPFPPKPDGCDF